LAASSPNWQTARMAMVRRLGSSLRSCLIHSSSVLPSICVIFFGVSSFEEPSFDEDVCAPACGVSSRSVATMTPIVPVRMSAPLLSPSPFPIQDTRKRAGRESRNVGRRGREEDLTTESQRTQSNHREGNQRYQDKEILMP